MSLADGHTHGKAVSGDLSDVPTAHDGEQDGDEGGTEFGLDAFEKSVRDAQAARKAGAANMKRPAGVKKVKKHQKHPMKRPASSTKGTGKKPVPGWSMAKRVEMYPDGCSKCAWTCAGCTLSCFKARGQL